MGVSKEMDKVDEDEADGFCLSSCEYAYIEHCALNEREPFESRN